MSVRFHSAPTYLLALVLFGCSADDGPRPGAGQPSGGGAGHAGAGGSMALGGTSGVGGTSNLGGIPGLGGTSGAGGGSGSDGTSGAGGTPAAGGSSGSDGTAGLGGTPAAGGSSGLDGTSGSGGISGSGSSGSGGVEPFVPGEAPRALAHFRRGINLGNRLESKPDEGAWGGRIEDGDLPLIAERGFDHVRIPVWFSGHAGEAAPFTLDAAFLTRVDQVLDLAALQELAVVLVLHGYYELEADVPTHTPRLLGIWRQLAERYRDRPETLAFELFNEPPQAMQTSWNGLAAQLIAAVRDTNPRRLLVIDSTSWADTTTLGSLQLPDDANLAVAVHPYEPKLFSFQGKTWGDPSWQTPGVIFPGPPATPIVPHAAAQANAAANQWFMQYNTLPADQNPSGPRTVREQIARVQAYRQTSGRSVMNTEWGPQDGGDVTSRANLMRSMREECEAAAIPWTIWEDPNNLRLYDSSTGQWQEPLVSTLFE
jgi:endoglucanase